ncbi:TIGR02391 family protein [uncultured Brachyspira sp.]|uniref:TIGR02391 family protein n=1 Tax=uncultured Brachyspira sp. TaxID=221953 RepID=UPI0026293A60|nr:TIGR02391 family protein [uncultured Brachyspira sp.]
MVDIKILEQIIDYDLFKMIEDDYSKGHYNIVITKSVDYFRDLLRIKSEKYNIDGEKLISECFGFKSNEEPKLIIGDISTDTGSSQQRGIESFAYGIHRYIRNPQSHGHYLKFEEVLDALIIMSFVIKKIKSSETKYNKLDFFNELRDIHFDLKEKYVDIILSKYPKEILADYLISGIDYVQNYQINYKRYKLVLSWYVKNNIDVKNFYEKISKILEVNENDNIIIMWLYILGDNIINITEKAKLRSENVLIKSLFNDKNNDKKFYTIINILDECFFYLDFDNCIQLEEFILKNIKEFNIPINFHNIILYVMILNIGKFLECEFNIDDIIFYYIKNDYYNILIYFYKLQFMELNQKFLDDFHSLIKCSSKKLDNIILKYVNYNKLSDENKDKLKCRLDYILKYYDKIILEEKGYYDDVPF